MDKSRFEHLVEKRMNKTKKLDFDTLLEMMEQLGGLVQLNEEEEAIGANIDLKALPQDWIDKLPKIEISERWGIGDKQQSLENENEARQEFRKYMDNIPGQTIEEKLRNIEGFINQTGSDPADTRQVISNIMFLELLSTVVNDFSPSGAGFLFEAFLAGLLKGTQMVEKTEGGVLDIDDLVDADNKPISLKLLVPTTNVKGSIRNLINFLALSPKAEANGIEYLCVYKYGKDRTKSLGMYSFQITGENIYYWLAKSLKFDVTLSESFLPTDQFRALLAESQHSADSSIEGEKTKAGRLTDDELKQLRADQAENYKKVSAAVGGKRGFFNNSDALKTKISATSQATRTAIESIIKKLQIKDTFKDAAQVDATGNTTADLSSILAGRRALLKRITQKLTAKKVPKLDRTDAKTLYDGIDQKQRENFFFKGITKVSNKDDIVDLIMSNDGKQGLKMLMKVAERYGENTAKARLDVDEQDEFKNMTDDEFGELLVARKKLRDDLRKMVRPDNKYLGFFKNTFSKAELSGDQPKTVEEFTALFKGTGTYGSMDKEVRRRKWANDLLARAGLSGSGEDDEANEKSQFEIKSDLITKSRLPAVYEKKRLGALRIDRDQIVEAADAYAGQIQTSIINVFVQLHELTDGLTDYFLKDEVASGVRAKQALVNLDSAVQETIKKQ